MEAQPAHQRSTVREKGVTFVEELSELSRDWRKMVNNPLLSDVTFIAGKAKTSLYGHRVILAARSKPMQVLLYGGMKESKEQEIRIKDIEPEVLLLMFTFMYCGCVELEPDSVASLFIAANKYDIASLKVKCGEFLSTHIDIHNVCIFLSAAEINDEKILYNKCIKFIEYNAKEVILMEEFLELTEDLLCKILQSEKLEAPELDLFLAVYAWGKHQQKIARDKKGRRRATSLEGVVTSKVPVEGITTDDTLSLSPPSDAVVGSAPDDKVAFHRNRAVEEEAADRQKKMLKRDAKDLRWRLQRVLTHIRFPQIPARALVQIVKPTDVVPTEELFNAASFLADPNSIDIAQRGMEPRWTPRPGHASRRWKFSTTSCGRNVIISNNQLTARKSAPSWSWVLGNTTFGKGTHIWKVHIDRWCEPMDGGIGVVPPSFEMESSHIHPDFTGYYISDGSVWQEGVRKGFETSEHAKVGDVIEMALNLDLQTLTISKNGVRMAKLYYIRPPVSPAFSLYYASTQISLVK